MTFDKLLIGSISVSSEKPTTELLGKVNAAFVSGTWTYPFNIFLPAFINANIISKAKQIKMAFTTKNEKFRHQIESRLDP